MDEANDRVSGYGPPNTLLNVTDRPIRETASSPPIDDGDFVIDVDQLQEFTGDGDLEWGQSVRLCYQTRTPTTSARTSTGRRSSPTTAWTAYSQVWGNGATPGSTLYVTVTGSGGAFVGSRQHTRRFRREGPSSYHLDFPDNTIQPGHVVSVNFGGGIVESVDVVEITALPRC